MSKLVGKKPSQIGRTYYKDWVQHNNSQVPKQLSFLTYFSYLLISIKKHNGYPNNCLRKVRYLKNLTDQSAALQELTAITRNQH